MESIVDNYRGNKNSIFYEVKWKNYKEHTWEPTRNLKNSEKLVKHYNKSKNISTEDKQRKRKSKKPTNSKPKKKSKKNQTNKKT